jgi:hypothetical protein
VDWRTFYAPAPGLDPESRRSIVSGVFLTMFTRQTRVRAFQRGGGLMAVRWKEPDDEDSAESDGRCLSGRGSPGVDISTAAME